MKSLLKRTALAAALSAAYACAQAQAPSSAETIVVTAERLRQSSFDAPAAIGAVTRDAIDTAGPQVNLSEVLNRVPGITVLNRQNYSQDLQLSIRGFGSRSTFGIRGVRLIVDGIPATMPDGQGQASNVALGSTQRIEVLRGPLAQLYGNAAGGVVQVFSGSAAAVPTTTLRSSVGRDGAVKVGLGFAAAGANDEVLLEASRFRTDGWREHSAAERTQLNAKWQHRLGAGSSVTLVLNSLDQPLSLDPLGLTRAQWEANPRQAVALAKTQDARKAVAQDQFGVVLEHALGPATQLQARFYGGTRSLDNALSIPLAAQQAPTASGGIVAFQRNFGGFGAMVAHRIALGDAGSGGALGAQALRLTAGIEIDRMDEDRQGYLNLSGQRGALKRDEANRVSNRDAYAQAALELDPGITASAGVRTSRVRFESRDRFIAAGNPDDSGSVDYSATNPVFGLAWRVTSGLNLYVNAGRGFETPTFTELAYRAVGTGLNTALLASRARHAEVGAKWRPAENHRIDVALFDIQTRDEIVVDTNNGGRSTFKNAGRTERRGFELSYSGALGSDWRTLLAATVLRANFRDGFISGSGTAAAPVPAGNRLPGTPGRSAYAELVYAPQRGWGSQVGFQAAVELQHIGQLYVNDANADFAPASTVVNLRAGWAQRVGAWRFSQLVRVDNAADRRYAGSVIVNEANRRFFEPAAPRGALLSLTAEYSLR